MPHTPDPRLGTIAWVDLTVPDAPRLRDFYSAVTGWVPEALSMGEYDDYVMNAPSSGTAAAGVCHARGGNADLPAQWLVYIIVDDLDASLAVCRARGGQVLAGPKSMGGTARYAVIRDPAGAVAALYAGSPPSVPVPTTTAKKPAARKSTKAPIQRSGRRLKKATKRSAKKSAPQKSAPRKAAPKKSAAKKAAARPSSRKRSRRTR